MHTRVVGITKDIITLLVGIWDKADYTWYNTRSYEKGYFSIKDTMKILALLYLYL